MRILAAILLALFSIPALAECPDPLPENTICLEWEAPTENSDGTPLTDLAGYNVYWGTQPRSEPGISYGDPIPVEDASATDATVSTETEIQLEVPAGGGEITLYFAMTALDEDGNESVLSNEVSRSVTIPDTVAPGSFTLIRVILNVVP